MLMMRIEFEGELPMVALPSGNSFQDTVKISEPIVMVPEDEFIWNAPKGIRCTYQSWHREPAPQNEMAAPPGQALEATLSTAAKVRQLRTPDSRRRAARIVAPQANNSKKGDGDSTGDGDCDGDRPQTLRVPLARLTQLHRQTAQLVAPKKAVRILRLPEVLKRVGLARSTIYQAISRNEFPQNVSLGPRAVGWLESEIDDWLDALVAVRDPKHLEQMAAAIYPPEAKSKRKFEGSGLKTPANLRDEYSRPSISVVVKSRGAK